MASEIAGLGYESILALEGFPDGTPTPVYVSGSAVMPFANPWSDVDVYVISDRNPRGELALDEGTNAVVQHFLDGRRVDFEFWRPARVAGLATRLAGIRLGEGQHVLRGLFSYNETRFVHRLRVGLALQCPDEVDAWRQRFDFGLFGRYLAQEAIRESDGWYEDVCGMLEADDLDCAVLAARTLAGLATDAYLHHLGNTDPNVKWRPRYLELFDDGSDRHREIVETYWRLELPAGVGPGADPAERRRYAEDCIGLSRRITALVQP
jgi:hypothetical protein